MRMGVPAVVMVAPMVVVVMAMIMMVVHDTALVSS
jgi:hypothetical protein